MQRSNKVVIAMLMITSFSFNAKANETPSAKQISYQKQEQEQIINLEYGKAFKVNLSANEINRISFAPNVIVAIWGDNTKYSALLSRSGSELFLTTKVEANKKIHLSVELSGGKVVDLELTAIESESAKIVKIEQNNNVKDNRQVQEITRMLEAMKSGIIAKYNVKEIKSSKLQTIEGLNIVANKSYRYEDLTGFIVDVTSNKKEKKNELIEQEQTKKVLSKNFKNVVVIDMAQNFKSKSNYRGANYTVYLVTRRGEEV